MMNFSNTDILMLISFVTLFSLVIALLMAVLHQAQRHNKELIGTMRDSYEKQIYMMNDRLTASIDRWRDVNHLVIGSQAPGSSADTSQRVVLSSFLKANGIQKADMDVEQDLVFVLIPFNNRYQDVFQIISRACLEVGLRCMRGDEEFIQGDILPHILRLMCRAAIIIANIDGRNANVFYELGLAHAMDKNTLLISKTVEDLPVDVKSKKIVVYKNLIELGPLLKDELLRLAILKNKRQYPDDQAIREIQAHNSQNSRAQNLCNTARELLAMIENEPDYEKRGIVQILKEVQPGYTMFFPRIQYQGNPVGMKTRLFRQGIEELVLSNYLYPPENNPSTNTRTYEYRLQSL